MTQVEKDRLAVLTAQIARGDTLSVEEQKEFDALKLKETPKEAKKAEEKVEAE